MAHNSYEKEQEYLQRLMDDALDMSDEDIPDAFGDNSEDDYIPNETSSESSSESGDGNFANRPAKKRKIKTKQVYTQDNHSAKLAVPSTSSVSETIEEVVHDYEEDDDDEIIPNSEQITWSNVTGKNLKTFNFSAPNSGVPNNVAAELRNKSPYEFFRYFIDNEIIELMVKETNRYAQQTIENANLSRHSRLRKWKEVSTKEIETFLGIIFWMGLNKKPKITNYWSKKVLYENKVKSFMSRNRFELILRMWHLSNNQECPKGDRLFKIQGLIDMLLERFQKANIPSRDICIDESIVPFRGKLSFKQYIKNKKNKFGIKLYKLCTSNGYTNNLKVYCGRDAQPGVPVASSVVMDLAKDLLDSGRVIYTDNFYTSVSLAHELAKRSTHLVGTLRSNRKLNPIDVLRAKLKTSETVARESNTGVVVLKWKDKRDVLVLSTLHDESMVDVETENGKVVKKPQIILDYNNSKGFIDISDQMKAYSAALRRGVKWYRKLAIELITGTALVNAYIIYKKITGKNINITKFKEEVTMDLLGEETRGDDTDTTRQCSLKNMGSQRRRCVVCYEKLKAEFDRKRASLKAKQTAYKCEKCDAFYCIECFFLRHKSTRL